jgi:tetracycline repressor-like protein
VPTSTNQPQRLIMADEAVGELTLPRAAPGQWRPFVERVARDLWRLYRRYPWLAAAISVTRPQVAPRLLALGDHMLGALASYGLDPPTLLNVHLTVFGVVRGLAVNIEPELQAQRDTGLTADEWADTQEGTLRILLNSGRYPAMAALMANDIPFELDRLFEFALQRLLDGLAPVLDAGVVA